MSFPLFLKRAGDSSKWNLCCTKCRNPWVNGTRVERSVTREGNTGMLQSVQLQRDHFFFNQMWVLESLGAWYRGATVLQGEQNGVEYVDGADLDLRGWWSHARNKRP